MLDYVPNLNWLAYQKYALMHKLSEIPVLKPAEFVVIVLKTKVP
jgi:hypothetical protein